MRIALVANARSGVGVDVTTLADTLRVEGADVEVHPFEALEGLELAGVDRLAVAAGDGGVGMTGARAAAAGIPLAVLPSGTANDFAGFLGIPDDLDEAAALAADPQARTRTIDVGYSGRTPFVNAASCGMAVAATENATPLKKLLGPLAYAVGAVKAGVTEEAKRYRVVVDGEEVHDGEAWQVIVSGTGAFGSGAKIEPADPTDGQLDVTVLHGGSRTALPLRAWGLKQGGLLEQDGVTHYRGRHIVVEGAESWNVDGELCEQDDCGRFHLDGTVQVVVP